MLKIEAGKTKKTYTKLVAMHAEPPVLSCPGFFCVFILAIESFCPHFTSTLFEYVEALLYAHLPAKLRGKEELSFQKLRD